ncbi:MAG TPA: hypothetical protein VGR32_06895 [Brevundimonas sp.]|jgi:TolA-binding protein|uniref:hypothetical protein n=1 Tax=Brevundimonas sp. TaxID=1871086 RepID=UPI002DF594E7|nr:hypothetical protein [Brevundimonas sp.]
MRLFLTCAAAFALALPVVTAPTTSAAQVLAGRNAARQSGAPRFTREERLTNLLREAEDRLIDINDQIASLESSGEAAGGLTAGQQRQLAGLHRRREREEREIARLETALDGSSED